MILEYIVYFSIRYYAFFQKPIEIAHTEKMNKNFKLSGLGLLLAASLVACNSEPKANVQAAPAVTETAPAHATTPPAAAAPQTVAPIKEAAAILPQFQFYKVKSGISFTNADLEKGKNTVFIFFDPGCGHCQQETAAIAKNYSKLKNVNLLFVSMNDPALMVSFFDTFGKELNDKPNVQMLYDRNQDFIQKIHVPNQFPANYVYAADGKLKSNWEGEKSIEFILSAFTK